MVIDIKHLFHKVKCSLASSNMFEFKMHNLKYWQPFGPGFEYEVPNGSLSFWITNMPSC